MALLLNTAMGKHPDAAPEIDAPIGTIAQVHGPVVDITCPKLPALHQALVSKVDGQTYTFEVHQHLDEMHARAITLHRTAGLRRGLAVFDTGSSLHVPVSPECLSRL